MDGKQAKRPYGVLGTRAGAQLHALDLPRARRARLPALRGASPRRSRRSSRGDAWEGVNVTIPYKKVVAGLVDELTPAAERLGNVNTVTRAADGRLVGDNTDYFGFKVLVESLGIELAGKRAVVFGGHGGAGSTCMTVLGDLGMEPVAVCRAREEASARRPHGPRSPTMSSIGCATRRSLSTATPVGMFPRCPAAPCSLDALPRARGASWTSSTTPRAPRS